MDPFAAYAETARKQVSQPAKLLGPIGTRADARLRYGQIVQAIQACEHSEDLEVYLLSITQEIKQFHAELERFWAGDGADFRGLEKEIEWARARVDDRLDFPRWEPADPAQEGYLEKELGQ